MAALLRIYMRALDKHPLKTLSTATGVLMYTGDAISQLAIEKKGKNYEVIRGLRFLGFGLFLGGPILRGWLLTLDRTFKGTKMAAFKMVACDQLLFAPTFLPFFLGTMGVLRRESFKELSDKIKKEYMDILITNWKIWPFVQAVNFLFVPVHHRVLVVNFVALGWNTYLAWKSEAAVKEVP